MITTSDHPCGPDCTTFLDCPGTPAAEAAAQSDPALSTLDTDLRNLHRRAELLAAHHDPRTVPQGVADAIHDALVALADARQVLAGVLL